MNDVSFSVVEQFQSGDEAARREVLRRIVDGYLRDALTSKRDAAHS